MTLKLRQQRTPKRTASGASIILICVLAILLIAAIWCAFHFSMMEGGSTEVRNVVDAAALNVGKEAVLIKVPPGPSYHELADSSGGIGLSNINRVWGKAYLINANMQSMQALGQVGPNASGNAEEAFQAAQQVNDNLAGALINKEQLDQYFNQVANNRMARMLGNNISVQTNQRYQWATAMVNRGYESNLQMYASQVPPNVPQPNNVNLSGSTYVAGYSPFETNNHVFTFTSFRLGEMPHLLGDQLFMKNRGDLNPIPNARNPIPNAWMEIGHASEDVQNNAIAAGACSIANPMRTYTMAIPYAYVAISFANNSIWYFDNKPVTAKQYSCQPAQTLWEIKQLPLPPQPCGGKLNGYASLGNEYNTPTLWGAFNALPGDHTQALKPVLQRLQEVQPTLTMNQLVGVMMNTPFQPDCATYYLYPTYRTPDLIDPKIIGSSANSLQAGWLQPNPCDGTGQQVMQEGTVQDQPNNNWENIIGGKYASGQHSTSESGTISWTPATGYQQILGAIHVSRTTQCYFTDQPP
jgi:hypothetical protein